MNDFMTICLTIIASIGGSSFIILKISKWCGNILSEKLLDQIKKKHEKEIMYYQNQLETYSKEIELLIQQSAYAMTKQYDIEFEIYRNIWNHIHILMKSISAIEIKDSIAVASPEEYRKTLDENNNNLREAISNLFDIMNANAPFYQEDIYNLLLNMDDNCRKVYAVSNKYRDDLDDYTDEDRILLTNTLIPAIHKDKDKLLVYIREYLLSMKVQYVSSIENSN